jgi:hypothetical protein
LIELVTVTFVAFSASGAGEDGVCAFTATTTCMANARKPIRNPHRAEKRGAFAFKEKSRKPLLLAAVFAMASPFLW